MLFYDWGLICMKFWFAGKMLELSLRVQKAETKSETDDTEDAQFYSNCTAFPS